MRTPKQILIKLIQFLYRNTAGKIDLGFDLGDISDPLFGYMSGTPVDRVLIAKAFENFVEHEFMNQKNSTGVEVGDIEYLNSYFNKFNKTRLSFAEGQPIHRISESEVIGDLTTPDCEISDFFDLAISTQVLVFVKDDLQSIKTFKKMMKPNAVLIGSEPLVAPLSVFDESRWGENRRYSPRSLRALLEQEFEVLDFRVLGNAITSAALVLGVPVESLNNDILTKVRHSHGTCMFYIVRKVV